MGEMGTNSQMQIDLKELKLKLKTWEKRFFELNGFKPLKNDVKLAPDDIVDAYKLYSKLVKGQVKDASHETGSNSTEISVGDGKKRYEFDKDRTNDDRKCLKQLNVWGKDLNKKPVDKKIINEKMKPKKGTAAYFSSKLMKNYLKSGTEVDVNQSDENAIRTSYSLKRKTVSHENKSVAANEIGKGNLAKRLFDSNTECSEKLSKNRGNENMHPSHNNSANQLCSDTNDEIISRCKLYSSQTFHHQPLVTTSKNITPLDIFNILTASSPAKSTASSSENMEFFEENFDTTSNKYIDPLTVNIDSSNIFTPINAFNLLTMTPETSDAKDDYCQFSDTEDDIVDGQIGLLVNNIIDNLADPCDDASEMEAIINNAIINLPEATTAEKKPRKRRKKPEENFVKINLKKKVFASRGYKKFNVSKYKRQKWKKAKLQSYLSSKAATTQITG